MRRLAAIAAFALVAAYLNPAAAFAVNSLVNSL